MGRAQGWRAAVAVLPLVVLAACSWAGTSAQPAPSEPTASTGSPSTESEAGGSSGPTAPTGPTPTAPTPSTSSALVDPEHSVEPPGVLTEPLLPADLLVFSQQPLSSDTVARIDALAGVTDTEQLSLAQVGIENRVIVVAAVDPDSYRRYTPVGSAQLREVWTRVAGGELAITPGLGRRLRDEHGFLQLGNDASAPRLHIGALAPQIPRVDAVVNAEWGEELGMRMGNALLISTGLTAPQRVRPQVERIVGEPASVQILGPDLDTSVQQTALLTGGSVARSVGTFSYTVLDHGRIQPDAAWAAANIRTERVPILGAVTCHRVLLPQLRAALTEVVSRGLAAEIHPDEYAGCYYPRYIAGTTQLSLHSFGIALDLNVPGNQRGTVGEIDRTVVAIFKKWGFAWGGDWAWTDPMHFELSALVRPG